MEKEPFDIAKLLTGYLRDDLSAEEQKKLRRILQQDASLRELLEHYKDTQAVQQELDFIGQLDKADAWQNIMQKRDAAKPKRMGWARYAAAAVVLLVAVLWWYQPDTQDDRIVADSVYGYTNDVLPGTPHAELILSSGKKVLLGGGATAFTEKDGTQLSSHEGELSYLPGDGQEVGQVLFNTLRVPEAATFRVVLPDGTVVWLNAMSELEFPVRFTGGERKLSLKGEGYFEVAHQPDRPFKVMVNGNEINVLGTTFNVEAYHSNRVNTTLLTGGVAITNGSGKQAVLAPGQQALVDEERIVVQTADLEKAAAWKNGYFHFSQDRITDIMEQLTRWYGVAVRYDGRLPDRRYGGSIDREVTLGEVLEMLKDVSDLSFEINGKTVLVKRR